MARPRDSHPQHPRHKSSSFVLPDFLDVGDQADDVATPDTGCEVGPSSGADTGNADLKRSWMTVVATGIKCDKFLTYDTAAGQHAAEHCRKHRNRFASNR
jgi:hypothetical protein